MPLAGGCRSTSSTVRLDASFPTGFEPESPAFRILMRPRFLLSAIPTATVLAWIGFQIPPDAGAVAFHSAPATQSVFLQQPTQGAWLPGPSGGSGRSHLPDSALPNAGPPGTVCSVDDSDVTGSCSALEGGPVTSCSAHCDSGQFCSAKGGAAGTSILCSTLGGKVRCSILPPASTAARGPWCSLSNGQGGSGDLSCSVVNPGRRAACSSQNTSGATVANTHCSADNFIAGLFQCSVLGGGSTVNNYCSVGFAPGPAAKTVTMRPCEPIAQEKIG